MIFHNSTFEFSLNVFNEFSEGITLFKMINQNSNSLCKRLECYHSASNTEVREKIFKLTSSLCFGDLSDSQTSLNSLNSI